MVRSNEELKEACNLIKYEILMLHHSLFRSADATLIPTDKNSFVESYAIHLRTLMEFIRNKPCNRNQANYIRALDYLESKDIEEWNKFKSKHNATFNKINKKANVQLAHLSYDREMYKREKKGWEYEFCNAIDKCLLKWVSFVPKSRIDESLIKVISNFQKITPQLLKKTINETYKKQVEKVPPSDT